MLLLRHDYIKKALLFGIVVFNPFISSSTLIQQFWKYIHFVNINSANKRHGKKNPSVDTISLNFVNNRFLIKRNN